MKFEDYLVKYNTLKSIKRFNMETVSDPQDLCGHGYSVGTLFYLLCKEYNVEISASVLFLVMNHDFAETYTGDLNKQIKDKNKHTKTAWEIIENSSLPGHLLGYTDTQIRQSLNDCQFLMFQLADALDAFLYCHREVAKGNSLLINAKNYYHQKVGKLFCEVGNPAEQVELLTKFIKGELKCTW